MASSGASRLGLYWGLPALRTHSSGISGEVGGVTAAYGHGRLGAIWAGPKRASNRH
jgi:hypothetical protein